MNGPLEWITSIGTVAAASMIAFDLGRRATAWGFVLFCHVSALWIYIGLTEDAVPLAAMNTSDRSHTGASGVSAQLSSKWLAYANVTP